MNIPRKLALKLLLATCMTAITLVAAEWILKSWFEEPSDLLLMRGTDFHRIYFETDPVIGVVRKPDVDFRFRFEERPSGYVHFRTNSVGLRRSKQTRLRKQQGITRVLVLGDSQLDGTVDNSENLTAILEAELVANGRQYEILNAATGSYSPYQNYLWYRSYGARLEPDIVVFGVFVGNDLAELMAPGRPRLVLENGSFREEGPSQDFLERMKAIESDSVWSSWKSYLLQRSALFARLTLLVTTDLPSSEGSVAKAYSICLGCTAQSLGQVGWFSERWDLNESMKILREILVRLKNEIQTRNAELMILLIPTRTQIEPELDVERIQRVCSILKLCPQDLEMEDEICRRLIRAALDIDIPVVDMRPDLLEIHKSLKLPMYYKTDWHCNTLAHEVIARRLLEEMGGGRDD